MCRLLTGPRPFRGMVQFSTRTGAGTIHARCQGTSLGAYPRPMTGEPRRRRILWDSDLKLGISLIWRVPQLHGRREHTTRRARAYVCRYARGRKWASNAVSRINECNLVRAAVPNQATVTRASHCMFGPPPAGSSPWGVPRARTLTRQVKHWRSWSS